MADVGRIARALGARIIGAPSEVNVRGRRFQVQDVECRDNAHAIALLNGYAKEDAANGERVRELAAALRARYTAAAAGWGGDADDVYARVVHRIVRDGIRFHPEDVQAFRSSDATLTLGHGNCVNTARLVAALAMAGGVPARVVGVKDRDGEIGHAAAQLFTRGAWRWAEATIPAEWGEEPHAAARRLGFERDELG